MAVKLNQTVETVEVYVFKCCTDEEGNYFGWPFIHNPEVAGDGPWFTAVVREGVRVEFGFPTKDEALAIVKALPQYYKVHYDVHVEPWD